MTHFACVSCGEYVERESVRPLCKQCADIAAGADVIALEAALEAGNKPKTVAYYAGNLASWIATHSDRQDELADRVRFVLAQAVPEDDE